MVESVNKTFGIYLLANHEVTTRIDKIIIMTNNFITNFNENNDGVIIPDKLYLIGNIYILANCPRVAAGIFLYII